MLDLAPRSPAPFGDRVEYRIADVTNLDGAASRTQRQSSTTSRAAHHLDRTGLRRLLPAAARRLGAGRLVNLDHIGPASQAGPPATAGCA